MMAINMKIRHPLLSPSLGGVLDSQGRDITFQLLTVIHMT